MTANRTVTLIGPFTDEDIRQIFALMHKIESQAPDKLYRAILDDSESTASLAETIRMMDELNPKPDGYERISGFARRKKAH